MLLNIRELAATVRPTLTRSTKVILNTTLAAFVQFLLLFFYNISNLTSLYPAYKPKGLSIDGILNFMHFEYQDIFIFVTKLYGHDSYLFFLVSLLLLTAMLGAIILATSTTTERK